MIGSTTEHEDEREEDYTQNDDNLERGEPELELAEKADSEVVYGDNQNKEYGYPNTCVDSARVYPVGYHEGAGSELVRCDNDIFEPVAVQEA